VMLDSDQASHVLYVAAKGKGLVQWRSYPWYRENILFLPMGNLASDNSTFWYCPKGNIHPAFAIFLSKSGRARVLNPDQNNLVYDATKKDIKCVLPN
jgi:hypothetical protein